MSIMYRRPWVWSQMNKVVITLKLFYMKMCQLFYTKRESCHLTQNCKRIFHLLWEMLFSLFWIAKVGCLLNCVPKIICEMGCSQFSHNIDHIGGLHQFVFEFLSVFIIFYWLNKFYIVSESTWELNYKCVIDISQISLNIIYHVC